MLQRLSSLQNKQQEKEEQHRNLYIWPCLAILCTYPYTCIAWLADVLHCHDGKADCQDVPYIFSVRISVSHDYDCPEIKMRSVGRNMIMNTSVGMG